LFAKPPTPGEFFLKDGVVPLSTMGPDEILIFGRGIAATWASELVTAAILARMPTNVCHPSVRVIDMAEASKIDPATMVRKRAAIVIDDVASSFPSEGYPSWGDCLENMRQQGRDLVDAIDLCQLFGDLVVMRFPAVDQETAVSRLLAPTSSHAVTPTPRAEASSDPYPPPTSGGDDEPFDFEAFGRMQYAHRGYIDPLKRYLLLREEVEINWPRELFAHNGGLGPPPVIDLAGGIRHLYYGPYLPLPAGSWIFTVCIGFGGALDQPSFAIEAYTDQPIAKGFFTVKDAGIYQVALPVRHNEPSQLIQVRIANYESVLDGTMALIDVRIVADTGAGPRDVI
jgi:hypothetical protein